jgi:polyhydroxyalkanoate synthesis regulator phasin
MPTQLAPVLTNAPFVDPRGYLTRVASGWLEASYVRQGGQQAASNTELAGGVLANAGHISQVEDDLGTTSANLAALEAEVTALQEAVLTLSQALEVLTGRVDTLETQVETLEETVADQETRLAALEAWRTAVVSGLPAVVTVATVPALANDPATAILLENDLTANWRPPVNANDTGLATAINAIKAALAA